MCLTCPRTRNGKAAKRLERVVHLNSMAVIRCSHLRLSLRLPQSLASSHLSQTLGIPGATEVSGPLIPWILQSLCAAF